MSRIENNRGVRYSQQSDIESSGQATKDANHKTVTQGNDQWESRLHSHGCPGCPHPGIGPFVQNPPDVLINNKKAVTNKNNKE
jgi:hypothetical protein